MTTAAQPPDATELCISCGLCCNGVLYSRTKIESHEVSGLTAGLRVDQAGDHFRFQQPCKHHCEGRCVIYSQRFTQCRTFQCALLKRFDAGEVALPEALKAVAEAKAMVARVAALDPGSALVVNRIARREEDFPRPGASDCPRTRLWLESLALELFLDRTFRNKPVVRQ